MKRKKVSLPLSCVSVLTFFIFPCFLRAQALGREALAAFPSDTHQMAYVNLAELRSLPNYRQLRGIIFNHQMLYFEDFLRSIGTDPEKDVDEAVVGWRGDPTKTSSFFGLAEGSFDLAHAQSFIAQKQLATQQYEGFTLDAFGSGLSPEDLFFTFIGSNLAAFGHLTDLKALIDGYLGRRATLNSNQDFVNWEAGLEGSGPEWGITTGKAALSLAAPWLLGASKQKAALAGLLGPIQAVLYQADWNNGFSAQISIICQNTQSAQTLAQLLSLCRDSVSLTGQVPTGVMSFIQGLQIDASGSRVELAGSGSAAVLTQVFQNASPK